MIEKFKPQKTQEEPKKEHPTGIPVPMITSKYQSPETTNEKFAAFHKLFKGTYDNIDEGRRPTILDFHELPPGSKEADIIKWITNAMEIPENFILDDGKTEDSAKFYKQLNFSYQTAKVFLVNTLKYTEKEVSIGPTSLTSKKDIFDLLNKTIAIAGNKGLNRAPLYCRIVKATLVASETLKHGVESLKENTQDFESSLVSHPNENKNTPLIQIQEKDYAKKFYSIADGNIKGEITSRWKDPLKVMLRFITRAESDAQTALKDGIASRIKTEEKNIPNLLPILYKWLINEMKVKHLTVENLSLLPETIIESTTSLLDKDTKLKIKIKNAKSDPTSMGDFKAIKITGVLDTSQYEEGHSHASQFEIQIVTPFNKNEKGKMDHSVFDVSKLVSARTRLDGGCPEHIFKQLVRDASIKSKKDEKTIIDHLIKSNIIRMKKKNNKKGESLYITSAVYDRWNEFAWVDDKLMSEINYSRNK